MKKSLTIIQRICEFIPKEDCVKIPKGSRGIYALLKKKSEKTYNVVYIGMSRVGEGIKRRIKNHTNSKRKIWSHFTIVEVKKRVSDKKIEEIEGTFRLIYRKDKRANKFNTQKKFKRFKKVITKDIEDWV